MNERIRELADRAGEYTDFESDICTDDFLGKFAELIVRECADILDKQIAPPNHPLNSLGHKLKEHFGVE